MSEEADVSFGLGAVDAGFQAAMESAREQAAETAEQIKASFESINGTFEKVQSAFLAFTAVLAGGEAFKEMIGSTVDATVQSTALGRQLGISASSASQLKVAMGAVFVTQDQVTAANNKITQALKKNESAFTDLGVATRDSNGHFRNALDIQLDVNEALMKFKEGTDRNVEGVKIYGRAWAEVAPTVKLTKEQLEEARIKSDALGLTIGAVGAENAKKYRSAMQEMSEVFEAIGKVIAEAVMPILTSMGEWFAHHGPEVVAVFRAALYTLDVMWIALSSTVVYWKDMLSGSLNVAMAEFARFAAVAKAALTPGASVADAWRAETAKVRSAIKTMNDDMEKDVKDAADKMAGALDANAADATRTKDNDSGQHSKGGDENAKLMAELAAELAAKKAAWDDEQREHGTFIQFSLQQEKQFWDDNLGRARDGTAARTEIKKNSNKLESEIDKAAYHDQIDALKESEAAFKNNLAGKLAIAIEMQAKIAQAEGAGSPAARKAGAEVLAIEREMKTAQLAIDEAYVAAADALEMSKIDAAQREAQLQANLGVTTAKQLLEQEAQFENDRYALKLAALQKKLALLAMDPTENVAKIQANMDAQLALETAHNAAVDQLRIKSVEEANTEWRSMFSTMQSGFSKAISGFLQGTQSLGQAIRGLFADVEKSVISALANIAAQQAANAIKSMAMSKLERMEAQQANAVKAGSAAWASAADIPVVGWVLGPIAGAAAYSGVMAMAEGGYDIPAGVNPIVQAHAQEMILPKGPANVIRDLANNGGTTGGGSTFNSTFQISAMDGPSLLKFMNQNAGSFAMAMKRMNNRFMADT